jgi:hypothetical protein
MAFINDVMEGRYDTAFQYTCYALATANVLVGDFYDSDIGPEILRETVAGVFVGLDAIVGGIGAGVAIARDEDVRKRAGAAGFAAFSGAVAGVGFGVSLEFMGSEYLFFF